MSAIHEAGLVRPFPYPVATVEPPAPAQAAGGLTFADFWRVLKQRKGYVIISFILCYALIAAAFFAIRRWDPAWPSEAVLEFRPPRSGDAAHDEFIPPETMRLQVETEARKIKQPDVIQDVLKQAQVQATGYYKSFSDVAEARENLLSELAVSAVPDTRLIRVRLALANKEEARLIVDEIVGRYTQKYADRSLQEVRENLEQFKTTHAGLREELDRKQDELKRFRASRSVSALEDEKKVVVERIGKLHMELDELRAISANLEATLESVQGLRPGQLPITAAMQAQIEADPELRFFRQQVEDLDMRMETLKQNQLGDNHRMIMQMMTQRNLLLQRESQRREELYDLMRERQLDELNEQIAQVRATQAELFNALTEAEAKQRAVDADLTAYRVLEADEKRIQEHIDEMSRRVVEAQHLADSRGSTGRLNLVQHASVPTRMSYPTPELFFGGGFAVALLLAFGVAFLRELTDKAIRTPVDVVRFGRVSVLGSVPRLDDEEADVDAIEQATRRAPHSLVAEAFRHIRAHLLFSGPVETQRVLLVSSPGASDGKTAVAINLAVTLAHGEQRVLLIDANFRRPAIRRSFNGTRNEGLSNILIGQGRLEDYVTQTEMATLDVLCSGPLPPTPAELLGSKYMRELLHDARQKYDRVIIDGPPVLLISDSLVMATQVDGVILVARAISNSKGSLRRAREQLEKVGGRVVGAILNGVETSPGGYFRRQYRDFYEYTADEDTELRELPPAAIAAPAAAAGASAPPPLDEEEEDEFGPPMRG